MADVFTLYYPDGRIEMRDEPVAKKGAVWTRGAYAPPTYPSPLSVRVGESGVKVWMVIEWWEFAERDAERLLGQYASMLTHDDILAAVWYYDHNIANKDTIDQRIREEQMA